MVNLIAFDTEKELCELTGLTESELCEKDLFSMIGILGFNQILNYIELRRLMIFRMVMRKMN